MFQTHNFGLHTATILQIWTNGLALTLQLQEAGLNIKGLSLTNLTIWCMRIALSAGKVWGTGPSKWWAYKSRKLLEVYWKNQTGADHLQHGTHHSFLRRSLEAWKKLKNFTRWWGSQENHAWKTIVSTLVLVQVTLKIHALLQKKETHIVHKVQTASSASRRLAQSWTCLALKPKKSNFFKTTTAAHAKFHSKNFPTVIQTIWIATCPTDEIEQKSSLKLVWLVSLILTSHMTTGLFVPACLWELTC